MISASNYKLVAIKTGVKDAGIEPSALIEDLPCDAVMLSLWNVDDDNADGFIPKDGDLTYDQANAEVYWGTDNVCGHQIFPQQTTYYIGVNNAHDISVRCSKKKIGNSARIFFTAFKYVPIVEVEK